MEEIHRKAIQRNFALLVETCNLDNLLPQLLTKQLGLEDINCKIKFNPVTKHLEDKEYKRELFLSLTRRGPDAFQKLVTSLRESGQHELAEKLETDGTFHHSSNEDKPISSCKPFIIPDNGNIKNSIRNAQDVENFFHINLRTEPLRIFVNPSQKFETYGDKPPMYLTQSKNRGVVLIINIVEYWKNSNEEVPYRKAALVDDRNLEDLFTQMGLKVVVERNLNRADFEKTISNFACNKQLLEHVDMALIVIMGHGKSYNDETVIMAADGNVVESSWIQEQFNNYHCSYLRNKPKMFFYQVCRGELLDYGIMQKSYKKRTEHDSAPTAVKRDRTFSDMLIAHSTLEGYKAHRDPNTGSWYIELICDVFMKHAHDTDVSNLLTIVDDKLRKMRSESMTMQTSSFTNVGFKKCHFHPGIYMEDGKIKRFADDRRQESD